MDHPILNAIRREGFEPLGWFAPGAGDGLPQDARFAILAGNAGPAMFRRFARERAGRTLDEWTRAAVDGLARTLEAAALYPFDRPPLPFVTWARRAGAGHVSPLGLNIHSVYGLWHAYRALIVFPVAFDLPPPSPGPRPCDSCAEKPCLSACPVDAFSHVGYDVAACAGHLREAPEGPCMTAGCLARHACPIGRRYAYAPVQAAFHMRAFLAARSR